MKKTFILKTVAIGAMALAFGFGSHKAEAAVETYIVNTDGSTGCGSYCAQLNAYLATQNTNTNSSSTSNTNNGTSTGNGTTTATTGPDGYNYVQYPYQTYTNFASTNAYYAASSTKSNYVQYPYPIYGYFQNPNPYPAAVNADGTYQPYPTPIYTYYGQSASAQLAKYKQATPVRASGAYGTTISTQRLNTGFILTSAH